MTTSNDLPVIGTFTHTNYCDVDSKTQINTLTSEVLRLNQCIQYIYSQLSQFDCGAAPVEELARRAKEYTERIEEELDQWKAISDKLYNHVCVLNPLTPKELAVLIEYGQLKLAKSHQLHLYGQNTG